MSASAKGQRSSSYPSYTIEYCLELVAKIYSNFGAGNFYASREQIAKVLGISAAHVQTQVSSASQYGLLDLKQGEGYKPTPLFKSIHKPLNEEGKQIALVAVFKSPPLYNALISTFENEVLPGIMTLPNILLHRHNISDAASEKAASIFIENAKHLGFLSESNVLSFSLVEEVEVFDETLSEDSTNISQQKIQSVDIIKPNQNSRNEDYNFRELIRNKESIPFNIPLKGGRTAQIIVPSDVKNTDFDFIVNFINLMKQQYD